MLSDGKKRYIGVYLHAQDNQRLDEIYRGLLRNAVIEANKSVVAAAGLLALKTLGERSAQHFVKLILAERQQESGPRKINLPAQKVASLLQQRLKEKGLVNMEPTRKNMDDMKRVAQEVLQEIMEEQEKDRVK